MLPTPAFSSPSLLSSGSNAQEALASSIFHVQKKFGHPLCLLIFRPWFLHNQRKKSKRRRKEKDQRKDQRVDHDPGFIQIYKMIILREEMSTLKRAVPYWSWVDTYRGRVLTRLRENLPSSRSRFKERNCEIGMWFVHILKFSMCSILAYEVDLYVLYFIHAWLRLKDILFIYFTVLLKKN